MILIVPVLNRYDLLDRMISSIDHEIEHLLIIDNGNALTELKVPKYVKEYTVLPMPSNLGVAASWNLGIKLFPDAQLWHFASADMVFGAGALKKLAEESRTDEITLTKTFPFWQTFAIGEWVVKKLGLFDESFYPIYFEDTDYVRRAGYHMIKIHYADIEIGHDNSSTINSDSRLKERNSATFQSNNIYFETKVANKDFSAGRWDLERRRKNDWAK